MGRLYSVCGHVEEWSQLPKVNMGQVCGVTLCSRKQSRHLIIRFQGPKGMCGLEKTSDIRLFSVREEPAMKGAAYHLQANGWQGRSKRTAFLRSPDCLCTHRGLCRSWEERTRTISSPPEMPGCVPVSRPTSHPPLQTLHHHPQVDHAFCLHPFMVLFGDQSEDVGLERRKRDSWFQLHVSFPGIHSQIPSE